MSRPQIALVDDNAQIVTMLTIVCRNAGTEVAWTAPDGATALRLLSQQPEISLLILDLRLPDLDGRQLMKVARKELPGCRILLLTGFLPEPGNGPEEADMTLQKGMPIRQLQEHIHRLAHRDGTSA